MKKKQHGNKGRKFTEEHKRKIGLANSVSLLGKKSTKSTKRTKRKLSIAKSGKKNPQFGKIGDKSPNWVGDKISKDGVHDWVEKWKGKPKRCQACGTTKAKRYEWVNVDHSYKRVLEDFIRMCVPCHQLFDWEFNDRYKKITK